MILIMLMASLSGIAAIVITIILVLTRSTSPYLIAAQGWFVAIAVILLIISQTMMWLS